MKKKVSPIFLTFFFLFWAGVTTFLLLPFLANSYLLPHLISKLPISAKEIEISRLTPWSLAGQIHLANDNHPVAAISRFNLRFTPKNLLKGRFDALVLKGATLHTALENGKLSLNGRAFQESKEVKKGPPLLFPIRLESLVLKNCLLVVHRGPLYQYSFVMNGEMTIDMAQDSEHDYLITGAKGKAVFDGIAPFAASFSVTGRDNGYSLSLKGETPSIDRLLHPLKRFDEVEGKMSFEAQAFLTREPLQLGSFTLNLTLADFLLRQGALTLNTSDSDSPATFHMEGDSRRAEYSLTNVNIFTPLPVAVQMSGVVSKFRNSAQTNGKIHIVPQVPVDGKIPPSPPLLASYAAKVSPGKQWQAEFRLYGEEERPISIHHKGATLSSEPLHLTVRGTTEDATAPLDLTLQGKNLQIHTEDISLHLPSFRFTSMLNTSAAEMDGTLSGHIPEVLFPEKNLQLKDIALFLPFHRQFSPEKSSNGSLTIKEIHALDTKLGSLLTATGFTERGFVFSGSLDSDSIKELKVKFSGLVDHSLNMEMDYSVPPCSVSTSLLPPTLPLPEYLVFDGMLEAEGNFSLLQQRPHGTFSAKLSQGNLAIEEKNIHISGINLALILPDLPKIQSSPSQLLTVDAMDFGSFHVTDGHIRYRLDDKKTLFIEKSRFSWCSGKIESGSLRLSKEMSEFDTTLYCDRLSFSELLTQFSVTDTEGEGSLNGKFPIHFSKSGLNVDGGFLFSTPGNSGIIKFNNTTMIRNSMPTIDKTGYLDYSLQALENFSYNWTRLTFSNRGNDLLLAMEIDGKPATPLPFTFQQGQMIPSKEGSGMEYPVRLDVNFLLPLKDMLQYGQSIQSIMENM